MYDTMYVCILYIYTVYMYVCIVYVFYLHIYIYIYGFLSSQGILLEQDLSQQVEFNENIKDEKFLQLNFVFYRHKSILSRNKSDRSKKN